MDSVALCLSGGRDQSGVVISLQWELGRFFFTSPPPDNKNILDTERRGSFLSALTGWERPQCSVSADSALGFLGVHEPRGAALGLRIPLLFHKIPR